MHARAFSSARAIICAQYTDGASFNYVRRVFNFITDSISHCLFASAMVACKSGYLCHISIAGTKQYLINLFCILSSTDSVLLRLGAYDTRCQKLAGGLLRTSSQSTRLQRIVLTQCNDTCWTYVGLYG